MASKVLHRGVAFGAMDQAASGLSNFLVAFSVVRLGDGTVVAAFGVASACYLLAMGASRSIGAEAVTFRRVGDIEGNVVGLAIRGGLVVGAMSMAGLSIAFAFVGGSGRGFLGILAIFIVPLALQETLRLVLVSTGRASRALGAELLWLTLFGVGCLPLLWHMPERDAALYSFTVWALAGSLSTVAMLGVVHWRQVHLVLVPLLHPRWRSFFIDFILTSGTLYAVIFVLGVIAPGDVAVWRIAQTIAAPALAPLAAMSVGLTGSLAATVRRGPEAIKTAAWLGAGLLAVGTMVLATVVALLPDPLVASLLSPQVDKETLIVAAAIVAASGLVLVGSQPAGALKILGEERRALVHKLVCVPAGVVLGSVLTFRWGCAGMATGLASGFLLRSALGGMAVKRSNMMESEIGSTG